LSAGAVPMQSVFNWKLEADMENTWQRKIEVPEAADACSTVSLFARGRQSLKALMRLFEPQIDLNDLCVRLREDAGIDEQELERTKIASAPLIR